MNIKAIIKTIMPNKLFYFYELKKNNNKKNSTYADIENQISKLYQKCYHRKLNWEEPKSYTEKLQVSKVYGASELKTKLTDKILVRDWIKEKIGEEYLVPMLGVYDKFDDINFQKLPDKFVIKCNHDSGSVTLCHNKKELNFKKLNEKYKFYLKRNFAYNGYEMHYKDIEPKIMIEKYMGDAIYDYKFLCFNGKPYYCWVDFDRFKNHKRNIYDLNWKLQPFNQMTYGNYDKELKKPKQFEKMKNIAEILCKDFDHVRVDLYVIDEKIYFGEMTFTNGNGFEKISPEEWDYNLGELWKFNNKQRDIILNNQK